MIEAVRLSKAFGDFLAVDDLSFQVEPGEVLGFLGPNGAGKSTTMKMLTGFLQPSAGTARINGFDIQTHALQAKREMGYLPEGAPAWGDMTVIAFLRFIAEVRGLRGTDAKKAIHRAIELVELDEVLQRRVDNLSKGFTRRVGLAQALLHNPKVLIMDEPTDGLDPNQKFQVRELIKNLSEDRLLIISTHILEEVDAVCTRAMIIARGRLLADGTPNELAERSRYHGAITLRMDDVRPAASLLQVLPQAAAVETTNDGRSVTVFPEANAQLFEAIDQVSHEQKWPVREMIVERGRLEEVFRDITLPDANSAHTHSKKSAAAA